MLRIQFSYILGEADSKNLLYRAIYHRFQDFELDRADYLLTSRWTAAKVILYNVLLLGEGGYELSIYHVFELTFYVKQICMTPNLSFFYLQDM